MIPTARVVNVSAEGVTILCPLCGEHHTHTGVKRGRREHRAAACGLYAPVSGAARGIGYTFAVAQRERRTEAKAAG